MSFASNTARKPRGKPFQKGNRANPKGRPSGSRNKATLLLDELAEGDAAGILRKTIAAAKRGDIRAAELVLSRIWPVRKGRPISLELPVVKSAADVLGAIGSIVHAVGVGDLTIEEAQALSAVLEIRRRAIETVELEARMVALERERNELR